jgi:electron transport complex protein RnfC
MAADRADDDARRRFADLSRQRYLARQARLARERDERAQRDAGKAQAALPDAVAAALARAKAKRGPATE